MDENEVIKKFGIDIESLKREQVKLAKTLSIKDNININEITRIAAIDTLIIQNKIIAVAILINKNFEILEEQYFFDKVKFPYLHDFRSYRELPCMIAAFNKLGEKPDLILVRGEGINHVRLGIASHLGLSLGISSIGVSESLGSNEKIDEKGYILREGKKVGKILQSKEKANPLYISPGNDVSIDSAFQIVKQYLKEPHKLPEPLHLAHKYVKSIREELSI